MVEASAATMDAALASSLPRVRAALLRRFGDFDRVEDALQDAAVAALEHWPRSELPAAPAAWLMTVARRRLLDRLRGEQVATAHAVRHGREPATLDAHEPDDDAVAVDFDDDLLRLIFTCCHPALARQTQVALTLNTVAGWPAPEIARALLTTVAAIEQRLARGKRKIRRAGIPYVVPRERDLPARVRMVATVVYLLFNEGYVPTRGREPVAADLCRTASRLAESLVALLPNDAELAALLALLLLHDARRAARVDASGGLVALAEQDETQWDGAAISRGKTLLEHALALHQPPGPYQVQAAIAALHASRGSAATTDWPQIAALYAYLERLDASPVVRVNRAVAVAMVDGPVAGLELLDAVVSTLDGYRPFHAARAALRRDIGDAQGAATDYSAAIAGGHNDSEAQWLAARRAELGLVVGNDIGTGP